VSEYWFARRFPVGNPRAAMAPVHWKGYAVSAIYVAVLTIGAVAFAWMGAHGAIIQGAVVFIVVAALGAGWFISVARRTCDQSRTVTDYRKDRARV
jgi:uncharacterized membrane protein YqjE